MANPQLDQLKTSGGPGAIGMLACCLVVIIGCWMKLNPETILIRAFVSGVAVTVLFRIVRAVVRHTIMQDE